MDFFGKMDLYLDLYVRDFFFLFCVFLCLFGISFALKWLATLRRIRLMLRRQCCSRLFAGALFSLSSFSVWVWIAIFLLVR